MSPHKRDVSSAIYPPVVAKVIFGILYLNLRGQHFLDPATADHLFVLPFAAVLPRKGLF